MTANAPVGKSVIGLEYNKKQVELLDKIFQVDLQRRGGLQAAQPQRQVRQQRRLREHRRARSTASRSTGKKFSLVFAGHHLTVRCDGNSEEATAFGGPLYYGHSPNGYATTNVFNYQTKAVDGAVRVARREAAEGRR